MEDWRAAPVFGVPLDRPYTVRPSAYGLIPDGHGRLAVVRTPLGVFLPGGGIEPGETPREAVVREAREECGLVVRAGAWEIRGVQFCYSVTERAYFEKRSTFLNARVDGPAGAAVEADHELVWVEIDTASRLFAHESHGWAVERWRSAHT